MIQDLLIYFIGVKDTSIDTMPWERQDSNLRRNFSTDLQSAAFNHSATFPFNFGKCQKKSVSI